LELVRLSPLFAVTALAEIIGCYLPRLVLKQGKSLLLLLPAAFSSRSGRGIADRVRWLERPLSGLMESFP
jgi:hypothetical protein